MNKSDEGSLYPGLHQYMRNLLSAGIAEEEVLQWGHAFADKSLGDMGGTARLSEAAKMLATVARELRIDPGSKREDWGKENVTL